MKQLHIVSSTLATSGGEGLAALRYAQAIARAGCVVMLQAKYTSHKKVCKPEGLGYIEIQASPMRSNLLAELYAHYYHIRKICLNKEIHLVHLHGMWSPYLAVAGLAAIRAGVPLVISPHGCLQPVALKYKYLKKWLALKIYQGAILRSASMFLATADIELISIRRLGLRQYVAIIPNGVDIRLAHKRNSSNGFKTILFLSRIHPNKGLLDLVAAWAIVRRPGWKIVIAGADEVGHRAEIDALININGLESDFEFLGYVDGARKQACFDMADIFVLPTYSENFGIAVAEALANELPVITTTGAPWRDLVDCRCGWWVDPGVQAISNALKDAIDCDPEELKRMGQRGRLLVIEKYSWDKIGHAAFDATNWLLNPSRPMPNTVNIISRPSLEITIA